MPAQLGGNIGTAITSLPATDDNDILVVEASSYQLETTPSLAPEIGILLAGILRLTILTGMAAWKAILLPRPICCVRHHRQHPLFAAQMQDAPAPVKSQAHLLQPI